MNRTNFEHAVYAILIQAGFAFVTKSLVLGAVAAAMFFVGREHAQREYHIGDPSHLKPWQAFDVWNWKTDAKLDLLCPIAAVAIVTLAARLLTLNP